MLIKIKINFDLIEKIKLLEFDIFLVKIIGFLEKLKNNIAIWREKSIL